MHGYVHTLGTRCCINSYVTICNKPSDDLCTTKTAFSKCDSLFPSLLCTLDIMHSQSFFSLVPRPHPLREGSGDIGAISWSCTPSRDSIELNVLSHMNAELAQPRNRSNVTRQRVGSRDDTSHFSDQRPSAPVDNRSYILVSHERLPVHVDLLLRRQASALISGQTSHGRRSRRLKGCGLPAVRTSHMAASIER